MSDLPCECGLKMADNCDCDRTERDGDLTIQHNAEGHWKRYAALCQWPLAARNGGQET